MPMIPIEIKKEKRVYDKKKNYWFKVSFGQWVEEDVFDPEVSTVYVEAWDAKAAIRKAVGGTEDDEKDVVTSVEYLGYPQV